MYSAKTAAECTECAEWEEVEVDDGECGRSTRGTPPGQCCSCHMLWCAESRSIVSPEPTERCRHEGEEGQ